MIESMMQKFRERMSASGYRFMILAAGIVGLLGGLGAVFFRYFIRLVQMVAYGEEPYSLEFLETLSWWHLALVPAAGGLLVAPIVYYFARETRGHGVPEVMEAVALKQGVIRKRIVAAKILASALCIGTGGSVGREGPIVQIGSAIGSTLGQLLGVTRSRLRTLVGCGAAAGIAATFNAPVAGVLFSLEIILGDFGVSRFTPIVISSVIATAVSHHFVGDVSAFKIAVEYKLASSFELISYSLLGLAAGLIGFLFIKMVYWTEDVFERIRIPSLAKPVLGGLIIGAVGLKFPHVFGVGYETIEKALNMELAWQLLLLLVGVKILATSVTLGSGGSGGIFAPSLFIGAVLGGIVGSLAHHLFPGYMASPGAYALVGMGAMVSAATHAPLTSIMIIFEMTGDYKIMLPLMFSCIIGNMISSKLNPQSIYTLKLFRRGVNLLGGRDVNVLESLKVKNYISSRYHTIREDTPLGEMLHQVVEHPFTFFYVTDEAGRFKGVVAVDDFRQVMLDAGLLDRLIIARDMMNDDVPLIRGEDSLGRVMQYFGSRNREEFPVLDPEKENRLLGVVTRQSLINAYNNEILKRDAVGEIAQGVGAMEGNRYIPLSTGVAMAEVEAPGWMVGKTLIELDLRRTRGIQVLMINPRQEGSGEAPQPVPRLDYPFKLGDNLVVIGPAEAIRALKG